VPDQSPEAEQELAFADVQLSVDMPPLATEGGSARIDTVGTGGGGGRPATATCAVAVALPPAPVQVSV